MRWRILTPVIVVGLLLGVASAFGLTQGIEIWLWIAIGPILAIPAGNQLRENTFRSAAIAGVIASGGAALIEAIARPSLLHFALIIPYALLGGAVFGALCWVVQTVFAE